jgi:hypothetical protein
MLTWVIGAGGLLGGAVSRQSETIFTGSTVPWTDSASAIAVLESDLARFSLLANRNDWSVVCATPPRDHDGYSGVTIAARLPCARASPQDRASG